MQKKTLYRPKGKTPRLPSKCSNYKTKPLKPNQWKPYNILIVFP